jgi:hypothetical protein
MQICRKSRSDQEAKSRAKAIVVGLVATALHVDGDFSWSGQSAAIDNRTRCRILGA